MDTPVTEASNPITENIDVASPVEIVSLLQKCDQEIFEGWGGFTGLYDPDTISTIDRLIKIATDIIQKSSSSLVVLSGCGTSGRIGFIIARTFNLKLAEAGKTPCFKYIIAGKDKALFTSQEAPEDDPVCGVDMLKEFRSRFPLNDINISIHILLQSYAQATKGKDKVLFIGITCGLSAPFVAGQLQFCLKNQDKFTPVLLGFNPTHLARNVTIENWDKTFLQVVNEIEALKSPKKAFILNPVVGPEPITGSSRMKSGSATKILLETIFIGAFLSCTSNANKWQIISHLRCYQSICDSLYTKENKECIARILALAGESLRSKCSIYYVGKDTLGIMGMVDASECPPTYGATLDDVRGFLEDGYESFGNSDGDLSYLGKHFKISFTDMERDILPNLKSNDLVIFISKDGNIPERLWNTKCKKALLTFGSSSNQLQKLIREAHAMIDIHLPVNQLQNLIGDKAVEQFHCVFCEICTKWICNSVTTGAHIMKGKVFQNIMVDLKVSNNKLFHRAVGIIQKFSGCCEDESQRYLLQSIYSTDCLNKNQENSSIAQHIEIATPLAKVVPRALLSAILKCSMQESQQLLDEEPVIRSVLSKTLSTIQNS